MNGVGAVSYTHLDVYKRQVLESFLEKFGGDTLAEVARNYQGYLDAVKAVMQ